MGKKLYTCQVLFYEKTGYYNSVENPEKLADFLESKRQWKYLNVFEIDKTTANRCGTYTGRRIYSQSYLLQKEKENEKED